MVQTSILGLLGALLLSCSCLGLTREEDLQQRHPRRIISFHSPSPIESGFIDKQPVPVAPHPQYLIPVPSEPAPVHEEQNEPPPPPPRARAQLDPTMVNPPGYAVDAANLYVAQGIVNQVSQPPAPAAPNAGVVQLARPVVPNAPNSIVNPPPPEMLPTTNIQPISIDPATGEPLKTVSPTFRALLRPDAPPVNVPSPLQATFGRGFGGAPILDVTGAGAQQQQQPQAQPEGLTFPSGFSQQTGPDFSNIQQSNNAFSSFQQSNSEPSTSSFQTLSNNGGDIISIQTFGATSSINSNSGSFGSTPITVGSGSQSLGESSASLGESLSSGSLGDSSSVTTSQEGASHSVHISLPQSSYSSTVFHGNSN